MKLVSIRVALPLGLAAMAVSCIPGSRFSELETDPPVAVLQGNGSFGWSLAVANGANLSVLAVGGTPHNVLSTVSLFEFSHGSDFATDSPPEDAVTDGYCGGQNCIVADQFAGRGNASLTEGTEASHCFTMGVGTTDSSAIEGLLTRCNREELEHPVVVPEGVPTKIVGDALANRGFEELRIVSSRGLTGPLLASSPGRGTAWYYPPMSLSPVLLPETAASFGKATAVGVVGAPLSSTSTLLAVAAPEVGEVRFYSAEASDAPVLLFCANGGEGFGRTVAAGNVDGDGVDDFAIADANDVHVFSGQQILDLATGSEACSPFPDAVNIAKLVCTPGRDVDEVGSCESARFGDALAIGDLDGDGDGEVAVGAPGLEVRGNENAGAVFVYEVEADDPERLASVLFVPSFMDAQLGVSLATPVVASSGGQQKHVIAAGAPENKEGASVALFYCPGLNGTKGFERCE